MVAAPRPRSVGMAALDKGGKGYKGYERFPHMCELCTKMAYSYAMAKDKIVRKLRD